jgi:citrate synthase
MNIDGATGVVFAGSAFRRRCAAGCCAVALGRRRAHAFEELESGTRSKGPIPRDLIWTYTGPPARKLATDAG